MSCPHCQGAEKIFSARMAERELQEYRTGGPGKTARLLIEALQAAGIEGRTLLDIGGGVGVIQHELLRNGASNAISVDASPAYLQAARQEAERQGHIDRITYHHSDFVELAPQLPQVDIVTLEKVICCYPDMDALVNLSSACAGRLYGVVFPRDTWWMRIGARFMNLFLRLMRNPFRIFIHPTQAVEAVVRTNGLERCYYHRTFFWQVIVYTRAKT
jgi:2-polyprenyl-3-methyl-5-hydroxy-6-metoxy-1,4-benzoquinol methylase